MLSGDKFFNPALEGGALEQHPALALEAPDADVRPQPHHLPFVAAAGVRFAQPDYITGLYFYGH